MAFSELASRWQHYFGSSKRGATGFRKGRSEELPAGRVIATGAAACALEECAFPVQGTQ